MTTSFAGLTVYTAIERQDDQGCPIDLEVAVTFAATVSGRYWPATHEDPAEGPEIEVEFVSASPVSLSAETPPLSGMETQAVRAWIENGAGLQEAKDTAWQAHEDALECAE